MQALLIIILGVVVSIEFYYAIEQKKAYKKQIASNAELYALIKECESLKAGLAAERLKLVVQTQAAHKMRSENAAGLATPTEGGTVDPRKKPWLN